MKTMKQLDSMIKTISISTVKHSGYSTILSVEPKSIVSSTYSRKADEQDIFKLS